MFDDYDEDDYADGRERIEISQPLLGFRPYVLIEIKGAEPTEDGASLDVSMEVGGGLDQGEAVGLLELVLERLHES